MAQVRILFLAVAALWLAGCGKNVCDKLADGYYAYRSAALGCTYVVPSLKIGDACGVSSTQCTGDDNSLLEEYGDCIGKIANCEIGKEEQFADAETTCYSKLAGLSDSCATGLTLICTTTTAQVVSMGDAYDNVAALAGECTEPPELALPFKTLEGCLQSIAECTSADLAALGNYTQCLYDLAEPCEDGAEQALVDSVNACSSELTLSAACNEALQVPAVTE